MSWNTFATAAPELAEVGRQLLSHPGRGEVAILATVTRGGAPRVAPVSPIFCDSGVYVSVGAHTPKLADLRAEPRYALHARVGSNDLEFQMSGTARFVTDAAEHARVVAAIPFPSYEANDPVVELRLARALVVTWPGRTTRGIKRTWFAA